MSTLSPANNRVMAVIAAVALAYVLRLPWYAPSAVDPRSTDGPVEQAAWQVARVFRGVAGTQTGETGIPGGPALLLAAAGLVALLAVVLLVHANGLVGDALRISGVLPLLAVLAGTVTRPDGFAIHYGLLVAIAVALLLANAAWHGGSVRPKAATAFSR